MSERKINHQYVESYSKSFTDRVADGFFSGSRKIQGKEIVSLTGSKQVNFLVIKTLFNQWQEETRKLESPFFDFRNDKVRKALVQFMNTLSQHISIGEEDFKPLLKNAVEDAIYLVFSPMDYFLAEVSDKQPAPLNVKTFKSITKYVKINAEPLQELIDRLEDTGKDRLDVDKALEFVSEVFYGYETPEEQVADLTRFLSETEYLDPDQLYVQEEGSVEDDQEESDEPSFELDSYLEEDQPEEEKEDSPAHSFSGYDQSKDEIPVADELKDVVEEEEAIVAESAPAPIEQTETVPEDVAEEEPEEVLTNFEDDDIDEFIDTQDIPPVNMQPKGVVSNYEDEDDEEEVATLNTNFASAPLPTVNDNLKEEKAAEEETLAGKLAAGKTVDNILGSISVNQRYMFTNELFGGNEADFKEALTFVEGCETFDESVGLLVQRYAKPYSWNMNSTEVKELLKVVFRKFRE